MKNYRAQTPQNLALTKILHKFRKTSTSLNYILPQNWIPFYSPSKKFCFAPPPPQRNYVLGLKRNAVVRSERPLNCANVTHLAVKCRDGLMFSLCHIERIWYHQFKIGDENFKQVCIPAGCVLPACWRIPRWCLHPGRGSVQGGLHPVGSARGGVCPTPGLPTGGWTDRFPLCTE